MRKSLLAILLPIAILCGQQALSQPVTRTISGSVTVNDEHYGYPGGQCNFYRQSFNDLKGGFSIVVKNGKGDILATASAPAGSLIEVSKPAIGRSESLVNCQVTIPKFTVPDSEFYAFELAGRKPIVRSRADLKADKWRLDLAIGQ
jgi:hypothetical protein